MNKKELTCYDTDASRLIGKAGKAVFPKKVEELQQIIKSSDKDIVPRGAGTNLVGGCVPNDSLVVDMGKMNKVSKFNASKKTVIVEAGTTLNELNEKLSRVGFEFPIDTFNEGISTIGGMVALNVPGFRSVKYGRIRDWIESIDFVNGRGELMTVGKSDLMDVCGMEGITGIITSVVLRVIPKKQRSASIFQSDELNEIFSVSRRLKLEKEVLTLEFFPPRISKLLGLPEKYHLIIEFDNESGKIKGEEYHIISKFKYRVYDILYSEEYYNSEDPKFFFDKLEEFILFLESNQVPYFGYLEIGVIHPFFKDDEKQKRKDVIDFIQKARAKPSKYGIGLNRKHLVDVFEKKVLQRIKLRYDPFLKLNKGKLVDVDPSHKTLSGGASHLKPIEKAEMEEIKPLIGEEQGASEIFEELKTPVEKMDEFIEKVELMDVIADNDRPNKIDGELEIIQEKERKLKLNQEINERIKDYEQTFDSELVEEKKKRVEDFALNVGRERPISSVDRVKEREENVSEQNISEQNVRVQNQSEDKVDYRSIQDIMTGKHKPIEQKQETPSHGAQSPPQREEKKEDQDTINKIMNNSFGFSSGANEKNKEDKDDRKNKI